MPGFVWVKTMTGARTAGFFAFRASDDKIYTSDGTSLELPPGGVMISGDDLITAISKSAPKGMYVTAWKETKDEWYQYLRGSWNEHLCVYSTVDDAITQIVDSAGMLTPRNSSKEVVSEKSQKLLKPMTVRARVRTSRPARPHSRSHLTTRAPSPAFAPHVTH